MLKIKKASSKKSAGKFKCEKCGKMKDKKHGMFVLGGSAFCCDKCCKRGGKGKPKNVCEFC